MSNNERVKGLVFSGLKDSDTKNIESSLCDLVRTCGLIYFEFEYIVTQSLHQNETRIEEIIVVSSALLLVNFERIFEATLILLRQ